MLFSKQILATSISTFYPKNNLAHTLMYHAIGERVADDSEGSFTVSEKEFSQQMHYLFEAKKHVISLKEECRFDSSSLSISFDDGYLDTLTVACPILQKYHFPFTVFVVSDYIKNSKKEYLSPLDLKELATYAQIGLHGKTHRPLGTLHRDEVILEISEGKKYLEDLLGSEITTLSYPHGSFNQEIVSYLNELGINFAFSSKWGGNKPQCDKLALRRLEIKTQDNITSFAQKIEGKWDWMQIR